MTTTATTMGMSDSRRPGHVGPCGRRLTCWRAECRARYGTLATVEALDNGRVMAWCHQADYGAGDPIARRLAQA